MNVQASAHQEAVFIVDGDTVARAMQFPEFEAVLDGFVPLSGIAARPVRCIYAWVDGSLKVRGAVFFLLDVDAKGRVDTQWNLPLNAIMEQAGRGPDLGAGPIRLACFSRCHADWLREKLWDPDMRPGRNHFLHLRRAVRANRAGLRRETAVADSSTGATETPDEAAALRARTAQMLKKQRLRIATLQNQQRRKLTELEKHYQRQISDCRDELAVLGEEKRELAERNEALKQSLDSQADKIRGIHDYFKEKLKAARHDENNQLFELQQHFELEMQARVQAAVADFQEKLDIREMELHYRQEQEQGLREEIARLRQENRSLLQEGDGQLLERLQRAGVQLVALHPGVGDLSIPTTEIGRYLEDPTRYAAERCQVPPDTYRHWLTHREAPRCEALDADGELCSEPLTPASRPEEFSPGYSDRCLGHRQTTRLKAAR